ncbi:hypothetical protein [Limnoglobus roseus]|uniref:Apea-like HEPN domain-containing protein n=1 Tax=Limnoglobus roseus TaxID=2598579 RepID=A0A5C1A856_9BACT|nr:hypothetical protein [Limnoglobus roseus]QEL14176.1 hypothetical protein PX52LOC_01046 [Limnoglobus roseus]
MADSVPNDQSHSAAHERGLYTQRNWKAWGDRPWLELAKYRLYSDAHLTGEATEGFGPYKFLNTVPLDVRPGSVNTALILRAEGHAKRLDPDFSTRDEVYYHGGYFPDEIAALCSLCLGCRIAAGGQARRFSPDHDPLGQPVYYDEVPKPIVRISHGKLMLPSVVGTRSLDLLITMRSAPHITSEQFVGLVRACRQYQNALWVAESEPNLAWLMLVSAVEIAANVHDSSKGDAVTRLRATKPILTAFLDAYGPDAVPFVAEQIKGTLGATKKFLDFILHFLPDPPSTRPSQEWYRMKWSRTAMKDALNQVYEYRSRALHGGIPFPAPMLGSHEHRWTSDGVPAETPAVGLGMSSLGGVWKEGDALINLHGFHHIVRGALLKWWVSMATGNMTSLDQSSV